MCNCKQAKDVCVRCGMPMPGTTNFHCIPCLKYEEEMEVEQFQMGRRVRKQQGDYQFEGVIVAVVNKRSGAVRYVVEDDRGLLLILNRKQLEVV